MSRRTTANQLLKRDSRARQHRARAAGRSLDLTMQVQRESAWCWAAVATSLARHYASRSDWTQCRLVSHVLKRRGCCQDGGRPACDRPLDLWTAIGAVGHLAKMTRGPASLARVRKEIDHGRAIGCSIEWSFGGGHAVLIDGYAGRDLVQVRDPLFGTSTLPYRDFRRRYTAFGTWTVTSYTKP
jgi:hypothetical protein